MNRLIFLLLTLLPAALLGDGRDEDICKHTARISKLKCERLKLGGRVCENRSSMEFHRCMVGVHSVALGWVEGGDLFQGQMAAIAVVILYSCLTSLVLLKIVDWTIGLRVSASDERQGLDVQQHGEEGYIFL